MKILIISHTYITNVNRDKWKVFSKKYPTETLKVVFPRKWPTLLFTHKAENIDKENTPQCEFIALKAFKVGNEIRYGYYLQALMSVLKAFQPDLIHVEQGENAFSYFQTIACAKFLGLKAKFSFFTWVNWIPQHSWKYKLFWHWIEKFNRFFSHGAIVGNNEAQKILKTKGFLGKTMVLPQLGVNHHLFSPAHKTTTRKYIGYLGRIIEEKGIMLLIKAFATISKKFPEWDLLFVGTGPSTKQLIDFTVEHNLIDRIIFKDPVPHDKVATLLNSIDILVLPSYDTPSWKEQSGHILIEAMACKVPIIASSGGEIPQVIADTGLIFPQKNQKALVNSLQNLMNNDFLRKELAEKGYLRSKIMYTHEAIAEKTYHFWKQLMINN